MELKKSPKVDLENKKCYFILVGLIISLGITLLAFEWKTNVQQVASFDTMAAIEIEEEYIPVTREEEIRKTTPPPTPILIEELHIVDNDTEIEVELEIEDTEATEETVITIAPIIQQAEEKEDDNKIFYAVEQAPEFPGGNIALLRYLQSEVKYPVIAQENGIEGTVTINFVVDKDGGISEARILRSVDNSLDKEALRVVNSLPKWNPGKQGGKAVRVNYSVPIKFKLQ